MANAQGGGNGTNFWLKCYDVQEDKENSYDNILDKYRDMVKTCKEYNDVNINKYVPNIYEMIQEDCVWDVCNNIAQELGSDAYKSDDAAFYIENPPKDSPGYYADENCFVLKVNNFNITKKSWDLGETTGDTYSFEIAGLKTNKSFTIDNKEYATFEEYAQANKIACRYLTVQNVGIKTANIYHYETVELDSMETITIKWKDINLTNDKTTYCYVPYKINKHKSDNPDKWTLTSYKPDDALLFYIKKSGGNTTYCQIMEDMNAKNYTDTTAAKGKQLKVIVVDKPNNKVSSSTILDGYKAQYKLKQLLEEKNHKIKNIYLVLDRQVISGKKSSYGSVYYNSIMYTFENLKTLINDFINPADYEHLGSLEMAPFGTNKYGTMLGNIWMQIEFKNGTKWINLAKYLTVNTDYSEVNPSFGSTEMNKIYNNASEAFKLWNNSSNEGRYVDSLSASGEKSYKNRINLHKSLTGIDFYGDARNCTVLIGDCMFMIPPQAIRHSSSIDYEKLPILRGKGSMAKNKTNVEEIVELDLYFNGEEGINGIPYETTTPNNKKLTYYMNGLRALVAQFRVAPFLPIENHYINDILNIEAVSLINLNVSVVDGFPKLLRATLTLRDFNYRVFLPDLPIPKYDDGQNSIAQTEPIFAKCFDWELFRYYYQRGILNGEELSNKYKFNTYDYTNFFYNHKTTYTHADLTNSEMEIFVPDINWLKSALQVKKTKDYSGALTDYSLIENTDGAKEDIANPTIIRNKNVPKFTAAQKSDLEPKVTYGALDKYGRCTAAYACLDGEMVEKGKNTERVDMSSITPTGWQKQTYSFLGDNGDSGKSVYERCHLIAHSLTGDTDLEHLKTNLITGTGFMNRGYDVASTTPGGMWAYENMVKDYLEQNPKNHVLYKVTPVFEGNNLVASGVIMEGYSVEDEGKDGGICFNVYIKNIQPYVKINYATGKTEVNQDLVDEDSKNVYDYYNYKYAQNMKFVPYIEDDEGNSVPFELDTISFNMSNVFTETHLKAVRGYAPQYMGGSDVSVEITMTISSEYYVSVLKALPGLAVDLVTMYRKVMPCAPVKIKNEYMQMLGLNEFLVDNIVIETKEGFPGVYSVVMRLTSVDRTNREKEMLKKINTDDITSVNTSQTIKEYFSMADSLSSAEVYPDLDLPTKQELENYGWKFAKWNNEKRLYVDPDFYVCYSFPYSAKLIKKIVDKVINELISSDAVQAAKEEKENPKAKKNPITTMRFVDNLGVGMDLASGSNGLEIIDNNLGMSALYDAVISEVQTNSAEENTKKKKTKKYEETVENVKTMGSALLYLTCSGIENGWQIMPGWYAPIPGEYIETEMKKYKYSGIKQKAKTEEANNSYIANIYDIRHRAIMLINRMLDKPLTVYKVENDEGYSAAQCVTKAVNAVFADADAKALLNLLCPIGLDDSVAPSASQFDLVFDEDYWQKPEIRDFIKGYLFALGCVRSGREVYGSKKEDGAWHPLQYQDITYINGDAMAKEKGKTGRFIPNNRVYGTKAAGKYPLATRYNSWYSNGVTYGAGQIQNYKKDDIKKMLQPTSGVKYFNYEYKGGASEYYNNMYYKTKKAKRNKFCESGFIDQYYNFAGYNSKAGKEYIELISNNQIYNYVALLRETLMHLKRLIMDGYFFGEVDVISQDWENIANEKLNYNTIVEDTDKYLTSSIFMAGPDIAANNKVKDHYEQKKSEDVKEATGIDKEVIDNMKKEIPDTYRKIFCSRMIYPFVAAAMEGSSEFYNMMEERNYDNLNTYTLSSSIGYNSSSNLNKFLNALYGIKMVGSSDATESSETTSNTQKAFNTLMTEAFTAMASDPNCYVLHSMYDMCINDKRGRLLRAFPCYYIAFVDEGRTIGTWRLFDNFYNMSSVSDIQIVKSRKIAADTCTFTMSNMYMSYTDTYDNSIYQQYVNAYTIADYFSSIFSPRGYAEKEDALRRRKQLMDTQPLSAGVRLHVRMGYGSDCSKLPIVFNGKIAELSCGETVEIVAQGDGHELLNPLNTLGDLTARTLSETQSWFTLFKDIRGKLARGGESPRNLLAKLSTAKYGGLVKTVIREVSDKRFYYDSPFGLYHFGDRRFKDIFEDSEIVQNMYEVSNKDILNGTNDLISDISTTNCTPTINCNIQDKTMWEIGHLCANSGDDFYFAVRDFGMRSTMCLCKANHYYAYEYEQDPSNNAIVERRKPFQQYHYYDSCNDIIYNALKASEANMKTNAVGIWEGSDYLWGTGQQSVGPIYLDMNIFPEYQKSMTVETGLIAGGDGGINIPLFSALSEKFDMDEYAGRVNKSLAEKVTTNVLRQSVKDMYEGEICVIGDPSLKPYDRVTILDNYEDMSGDVEVETVIHSMNMETGFTTTFIPDLIVRAENSAQEYGSKIIWGNFIFSTIGTVVAREMILHAASGSATGLLKIGTTASKLGASIAESAAGVGGATKTAIEAFVSSAGESSLVTALGAESETTVMAAFMNPVGLTAMAAAAVSVYAISASIKESFARWCRNIQALTVFPISKNQRPMVAGMAGHKGSVYGYSYNKANGTGNAKDSIQSYVMKFMEDDASSTHGLIVRKVFQFMTDDESYQKVKDKWVTNLGLTEQDEIVNKGASEPKNYETFWQNLTGSISKEYSSRAVSLATLKTKPRIRSFNTKNRTSETYLKYQIGGTHDKTSIKNDNINDYVEASQLATNERIKELCPVEDESDIKLALQKGAHGNIKQLKFAHSKGKGTFDLQMESESTEIRYIIDKNGIFDLPMLRDDAIVVLKLIMNEDALKDKDLEFLSGTRVNSTNSWQSTGFAFTLASSDMTALETAVKNVKAASSWNNKENFPIFAYKVNGNKSIAITVYAPLQ